MAREHMQSWKQGTQMQPTVAAPVQSTVAPPAVSAPAQNFQHPNQFQVRKPERVAPPPRPPIQEWRVFSPYQQAAAQFQQFHPAAPLNHPPSLQTPTNNLTNTLRSARNTGDAYNGAEVQTHHLDTTADRPVVTSTDPAPTVSAPPSSQPSSTQSILLASEEKGTALYTMRGLAASIKRSLNAERLAASMEPSASSDSLGQKRKRSNSIEVIDKPQVEDPEPKAEPQPVDLVTEPPSILPSSVSISEETTHIPNTQLDSSPKFVPFSTLTGAVSFVDSVPVNQNPATSPEATAVLEDLTTSQSTPQPDVLFNHIEDSSILVSQPSYDPFSFPHRTPTPPLAATITTVHDECEIDENAVSSSSPHPSTLLHEIEADPRLQLISPGNEDDIEMSVVAPGEDHVQTQLNIASTELSQALDNDTLMQEADVSSGPSIRIDRTSIESSIVEDSEGETRSSPRAPEELPGVLPRTSPIRVQSVDLVETSGPSSFPKLPRKPRRKQEFYIAIPPASEWVLQAKHREAERKALVREKAGELGYLKSLVPFLMHLRAEQ